ncbi:Dual specificity mitogen-activated protein kinase kinase 6 [Acipenser ruthenus]|uniref:mitogen-activated protein kinase kinase n=1 Tax=Acipenser ruthenus TaxID=7906 RepID=A0A444UQB4_ACIRT|nr:Dual specificity mitogen-activated protein kinase kinase 6 [Acipenser ruthenus]
MPHGALRYVQERRLFTQTLSDPSLELSAASLGPSLTAQRLIAAAVTFAIHSPFQLEIVPLQGCYCTVVFDTLLSFSCSHLNFEMKADDLEQISELGRGAYGVVDKMRHVPSGLIMAVKRIRATVNSQEQKRLLMDLDISMRTVDCHFTVTFYGALFREGDVWICMELMDTSLDKFYKQVIEKGMAIPEDILGKITVSIVKALEHLHSRLSVIHRDVKPSNVLINTLGQVKMCDFGISGYLVDSVAKTMDAGCKPYMAVSPAFFELGVTHQRFGSVEQGLDACGGKYHKSPR